MYIGARARGSCVFVGHRVLRGCLIVVEVVKGRTHYDHDSKRLVRWVVVDRANKDLPHQPEAASEHDEINDGLKPERTTAD